jgi:hypothetical protein
MIQMQRWLTGEIDDLCRACRIDHFQLCCETFCEVHLYATSVLQVWDLVLTDVQLLIYLFMDCLMTVSRTIRH